MKKWFWVFFYLCSSLVYAKDSIYFPIPIARRFIPPKIVNLPLNVDRLPTLEEEKGKVVVLIFWAKWCVPGRQELPILNHFYDHYHGQGVDFIGLADEYRRKWSKKSLLLFFDQNQMKYPIGIPSAFTEYKYKIKWYPTFFFLDRSGRLAAILIDYEYKPEKYFQKILDGLLAEK